MRIPEAGSPNSWYRRISVNSPAMVFVHGRNSNHRDCWLNMNLNSPIYWPSLLATEPALADWGIYLAGYDAFDGDGTGISGCAEELFHALENSQDSPLRREIIVFVTHSLGGIVMRKIIVDHFERFRDRRVFLYLLASPSTGATLPSWIAALYLRIVGLFCDKTLSKQLTIDRDLLKDLDRQFRRLVTAGDERYLPELTGAECSESSFIRGWPLLGRLVEHYSTPHYFDEPRELRRESHATICKPSTRRSPAHALLVSKCAELYPQSNTPNQAANDLDELLESLKRDFRFRFEPAHRDRTAQFTVYWPVRVRRPTPIHAQQAFVAASLTRHGGTVELWIDDLGNQDYSPENMVARLRKWFASVDGDTSRLLVKKFTEKLSDDAVKREAWELAKRWLGDTEQTLDQILRLSKLTPRNGEAVFEDLLKKRPRRLLTPPIVWLGLRLAANVGNSIITLGGEDEIDLWQAWRSLDIDPGINAGHLYGASLREVEAGKRKAIHMRQRTLAWDSVDDIWKSFDEAAPEERLPTSRDTLRAWCVEQCIFLPQYIEGDFPIVAANGDVCRSVEELWNLPASDRDKAIVEALEKRIL